MVEVESYGICSKVINLPLLICGYSPGGARFECSAGGFGWWFDVRDGETAAREAFHVAAGGVELFRFASMFG